MPSTAKGLLFILIGPSGAGKNSLMEPLITHVPALRRLPTAATRAPRPGEVDGRDHFFISEARFQEMAAAGELAEYEEVHPGKWYGTVLAYTQQALDEGQFLLADIDIIGALKLKALFGDSVVTVFIAPSSLDDLITRIRNRGPIEERELQQRRERAAYEMSRSTECDYQVVNDIFEQASAELIALVEAAITKRMRIISA
jgi:guanylate kinase